MLQTTITADYNVLYLIKVISFSLEISVLSLIVVHALMKQLLLQ